MKIICLTPNKKRKIMDNYTQFVNQIKAGSLILEPGNPYHIEQLKAFLICGYSLTEIFSIGVSYKYHEELEEFDKLVREERGEWQAMQDDAEDAEERAVTTNSPSKKISLLMKTISYYKHYLQKWENNRDYRVEEHISKAKREVERIEGELPGILDPIKDMLFADMKERPWNYLPNQMKRLFDGASESDIDLLNGQRDKWNDDNKIINEALVNHITITIDELKEKGIVPRSFTKKNLCDTDYGVVQPTIDKLGEFPTGRTDIFFLGVPRSGKSSALAGILYKMRDGEARYIPQLVDRIDVTQRYKTDLLNCIVSRKCPVSTDNDSVCFMKFDLRRGRNRMTEVNFVEMSGEAFEKMVDATSSAEIREIWERRGAEQFLSAPNKKLLFLVIDYAVTKDINTGWLDGNGFKQSMMLDNALISFFHDGTGKDGRKGCTMSKISCIAFIMTKCDLMPKARTWENRKEIAEDYINANFQNTIELLKEAEREYHVRVSDRNGRINLIPFSLGKFYVGNTYEYDPYDSGVVIDFIKQTLPSTGGFLGGIGDIINI